MNHCYGVTPCELPHLDGDVTYCDRPQSPNWSQLPRAQQSVGSFHAECDPGIQRLFLLCGPKCKPAISCGDPWKP